MSAKFTPGPWIDGIESDDWSVNSDNHRSISWVGIGPKGQEPVAFAVWAGHYADPEYNANARLMAAAPELLALVYQYLADLKSPPAPYTVERRMDAIGAVLLKIGEN